MQKENGTRSNVAKDWGVVGASPTQIMRETRHETGRPYQSSAQSPQSLQTGALSMDRLVVTGPQHRVLAQTCAVLGDGRERVRLTSTRSPDAMAGSAHLRTRPAAAENVSSHCRI
eukprot:6183164-Pleurochrysis_carterae.AAC.1